MKISEKTFSAESPWTDAPFLTGRKKARWMNGFSELSVEEKAGESVYLLKYRPGRFNTSMFPGGEFENFEEAVRFGEDLTSAGWEIDTDPVWHRSKIALENGDYSINIYDTDMEGDRVVLTYQEGRGAEELKSQYFEDTVSARQYMGELLNYAEVHGRNGEDAAEIVEFFRNF